VMGLPAGATTFEKEVMSNIPSIALESIRAGFSTSNLKLDGYADFKAMVDRNISAGKGLLFITAHLGSWELTSLACHWACGGQYTGLAKASKTQAITRALMKWRRVMNIRQLWTNDPNLVQEMTKVVKEGHGLGFAMDQKPNKPKSGLEVPFLGRQTSIVTGPAWISSQLATPVVSIYVIRQGFMHYKIICNEVIPPNHKEKSIVKLTELMARDISRAIMKYGNQWMWTYKRWDLPAEKPSEGPVVSDLEDPVPI
jgi:KDO2-lipid IV(A) lauroyltransferase